MCTKPSYAFNEIGEVIELACDSWSCAECCKVLAWRWAERIRYGIALRPDHRAWFWTLTLPAWVPDQGTGYRILPERWTSLRQTLRRTLGDFHYAAFVEAHPHRSFIPHFHVIALHQAPKRLKDMAVHAGFGYQATEREINSRQAVSYVTKYASKQGANMPKNFRRVRISQSWPSLPSPSYEYKVYPLARGETLSAYLRRLSPALGLPLDVLREHWLEHLRDTDPARRPVVSQSSQDMVSTS